MESNGETKMDIKYVDKYSKKPNSLADKVIEAAESGDRVAHWKAVYNLIRHQNKKARKEQDKVAKEVAEVRAEKIFTKRSKVMGLKFGVSMPEMTWDALVKADTIAFGRSDLRETNKEDHIDGVKGSNQIVRDLAKAFPQYRVS